MSLKFKASSQMTIGAELELQLLDRSSYELSSSSPMVLRRFPKSLIFKPEIFQSMIEITSAIRNNAKEVGDDLREAALRLRLVSESLGLQVVSAGTHPFSSFESSKIYPDERYSHILAKNPWLARKLLVFGLHVHVGMRSGDHAVQVSNALAQYLPLLLALSSSSPFSSAEDTHFASSRSALFETLPNSGQAYAFDSWSEFQEMYMPLVQSGAIDSFKDLWWDIRPSPIYGTLEVRICDSPSTILETEAIVALIHLLCMSIDRDLSSSKSLVIPAPWIVRENKWRALRQGVRAELLEAEGGITKSVPEILEDILSESSDLVEVNGYDFQVETLRNIVKLGSSSDRQRLRHEHSRNNFTNVLSGLVEELKTDHPQWALVKKNNLNYRKEVSQCAVKFYG